MEGLVGLMLVVVPGMADWVAVTEPPRGLRPERFKAAAWLPCDGAGGATSCAKVSSAKTRMNMSNAICRIIVSFHLTELFAKPPCAERDHHECNYCQGSQFVIQNVQMTAFQHDAASNN